MERRIATVVLAFVMALFALTMTAYAGGPDDPHGKPSDHPSGRPTEPPRGRPTPSPTPTVTPTEDPTPTACADGSRGYDFAGGTAEYVPPMLHLKVAFEEPTCPDVDYVLYVTEGLSMDSWTEYRSGTVAQFVTGEAPPEPTRDGTLLVEPDVRQGDGTTVFEYTLVVPEDDPSICIFSEAIKDGYLLDRAYDSGCMDVDFLNPIFGPGRTYD